MPLSLIRGGRAASPDGQGKRPHPLPEPFRGNHFLPLFLLTNFGLSLLGLFLMGVLLLFTLGSAGRDRYAYIQLVDGQVVAGRGVGETMRTEATLHHFVQNWLLLSHNWPGTLANGQPDIGEVHGGRRVPTPLMAGSWALLPGFREAYLDATIQKYGQRGQFRLENYLRQEGAVVLRILHQSRPQPVKPGVWDVKVVASRLHFRGEEHVANESFNQTLRVMAVTPIRHPLADNASPLEQQIYALQQQGLAISQITSE